MDKNYNFLTDIEILKWNDRLCNSDFLIKPHYGSSTSYPSIFIYYKYIDMFGVKEIPCLESDPYINLDFMFSVSSNRIQNFFDILNKIIKKEFITEFTYHVGNNKYESNKISIPDGLLSSIEEEDHYVLKKTYKKYTYKFRGKLSSIMAYISCINDTINIFELMWGYDENGNEYCLIDYPIGTIVSTENDKSKDYLVLDFTYVKDTNGKFVINYICSEMLNTDSCIIQYGETKIYQGSELCYSRNNRIDDILN